MTIPFSKARQAWRKDPAFRATHAELEEEFALARELIRARTRAGLSQQEVAERMGISQPTIARLEAGHKPSLRTLERYAAATGAKLEIRLVDHARAAPS